MLRIYKDSGIGKTAASYCKTYTYDLAGNRTGFTLEKGDETVHNISYSYDNLNRLSTVSENGATKKSYKISRSCHRFDDSSFFICCIPIFLSIFRNFFDQDITCFFEHRRAQKLCGIRAQAKLP